MIKLIASDLDGTLLDGEKRLPQEIFPLIRELSARGVRFLPASGRQAFSLEELFAPVLEEAIFLCENGALVKHKGEVLYCNPIPDGLLTDALTQIRAIPHLHAVFCGVNAAYLESKAEPFRSLTHRFYPSYEDVDDLHTVIGREPICKIAVYDDWDVANNAMKRLPQRLPLLRVIQSGNVWCDVSAPSANKGTAFAFLREKLGLNKEECVAFGDHMNDYELLSECGHPFVTANAYPPLKQAFPNVVPANTEGGVITKIKELIKQIDGGIL